MEWDRRPAGEPVTDYRAPDRTVLGDGGTEVVNHGAQERLIVRETVAEEEDLTLLFLDGRAARLVPQASATGLEDLGSGATVRSLWAELDGDRILAFDERGRVVDVLQGGEDGGHLSDPVAAIVAEGGVLVEERDGGAVFFPREGSPERLSRGSQRGAPGVEGALRTWARSPLYFSLAPVPEGAPLLRRIEPDGRVLEKGVVSQPENRMLGELVNAGWAVPDPDRGTVFARALDTELIRFDEEGGTAWRATWSPERPVTEPELQASGGALEPRFSIRQQGLAVGPDGRYYVLASDGADATRPARLLVFEPDGTLLRQGTVAADAALFVDPEGRVFTLPAHEALSRSPARERRAFAPFDLPALEDSERVRLEDYEGRAVVVNFWASWCPPCRREIPLLDELARTRGEEDIAVVGLNEDVRPEDGRMFLQEVGGTSYSNAEGRGELRSRYGYRGLPYTVVLDREHRVVETIYGFGSSLAPIESALDEALAPSPGEELGEGR